MAQDKNNRGDHPLRETEDAAYHAFREWPVLLVLRQKELEAHHPETKAAEQPAATNVTAELTAALSGAK